MNEDTTTPDTARDDTRDPQDSDKTPKRPEPIVRGSDVVDAHGPAAVFVHDLYRCCPGSRLRPPHERFHGPYPGLSRLGLVTTISLRGG